MKFTIFLACLLFCFSLACHAQSPKKTSFEVGVDVLSLPMINYWYDAYIEDKDIVKGISGIFLSYNRNRLGFRASANYYYRDKELNTENCRDCYTGSTLSNAKILKFGFQYQILKNSKWLYAFSDLTYNIFKNEGNRQGGFTGIDNFTFMNKRVGYGLSAGLGAKIKLYKRVYLLPELSFGAIKNHINYHRFDITANTHTITESNTNSINPSFRLLLTAKF